MCYFIITCYTNFLLYRIHPIAYLLGITCSLVATSMGLGRLECIMLVVTKMRMILERCVLLNGYVIHES